MPRILLLDDEPLIAMMMQGWLTELDCEIVGPVHSVRSALMLLDGLDGVALDGAILDLSLGNNEKSYAVASVLRDPRYSVRFRDRLRGGGCRSTVSGCVGPEQAF